MTSNNGQEVKYTTHVVLFMHFYDSNLEATQMQQEEKQQHQRSEINFMLIRI